MIKSVSIGVLALWLLLPMAAAAQDAWQYPLAEDTGVIQKLEFGASTLVIDSMRYDVAVDVKVEIGGSFGAFTMLATGMRVYYEFRRISPAERVVTLIRELPRDVEMDEV